MSNHRKNKRRQRLPDETDAVYIARIREMDEESDRKRRQRGGVVTDLRLRTPALSHRDPTRDNAMSQDGTLSGTMGHSNVPQSPNQSPTQSPKKRPPSVPPKAPYVPTLYGKPIKDWIAPSRKDIPIDPPSLTLIHGGERLESNAMAQAGGMTPYQPGQNQPPNVPSNVPSNVPNVVGEVGVSPPYKGGGTTHTNARVRERDFEGDFDAEEEPKKQEQCQSLAMKMQADRDRTLNGTLNGTMGHSNVPRDIGDLPPWVEWLRAEIVLTRQMAEEAKRRSEQSALAAVRMRNQFAELQRYILKQPRPPKPPTPCADPAFERSIARIAATEEAQDELLLAGMGDGETLPPLDLPALTKADADFDEAMAAHFAQSNSWNLLPPEYQERTELISDVVKKAIEHGYVCAIRSATERERWHELAPMSHVQRVALDEIYLQAINISKGDPAQGFALFMLWCEGCAADKRKSQAEKNPRYMLISSDLCTARDLGPQSTWWTVERVNAVWQSQTESST